MRYCREGSASTKIPPTSAYDDVGWHYKISESSPCIIYCKFVLFLIHLFSMLICFRFSMSFWIHIGNSSWACFNPTNSDLFPAEWRNMKERAVWTRLHCVFLLHCAYIIQQIWYMLMANLDLFSIILPFLSYFISPLVFLIGNIVYKLSWSFPK